MDVPIADDYAGIAQRLREITGEDKAALPAAGWGIQYANNWIGWNHRVNTWEFLIGRIRGDLLMVWRNELEAREAMTTLGSLSSAVRQEAKIKPYTGP